MNDNKKFWVSRLGIKILIAVLISMLCAIAVSMLLGVVEKNLSIDKIVDREYVQRVSQNKTQEFQEYVTANSISKYDRKEMELWVRKERDVMMHVYDTDRVIYDSTIFDYSNADDAKFDKGSFYKNLNRIEFSDGYAYVDIFCFVDMKIHMFVTVFRLLAAFVVFVIVLLLLVKRRIVYIYDIQSEINILEGGNLDYPITIKGNDELALLAKSIDDMRLSIIEKQKEEEKARSATSKLVTAMSHDLRTPLTVLIGLLEILENKKYENQQQLETYIHKSRDKAYQIKSLSDKIFKYFLAFSTDRENLNMSKYDMSVIHELIGEFVFSLEDKDFIVDISDTEQNAEFYVDIEYIHRVFDNVFSNIIKYADNSEKVSITIRLGEKNLFVEFTNKIKDNSQKTESTNIGLETCRNIMALHNGEFDTVLDNGSFKVCVRLPRNDVKN